MTTYEIVNHAEVAVTIKRKVDGLSYKLGLEPSVTRVLIFKFQCDEAAVLRDFKRFGYSEDFVAANIDLKQSIDAHNFMDKQLERGFCTICEQSTLLVKSMICEHKACKTCWNNYINTKVSTTSLHNGITCIETGCQNVLRDDQISCVATDAVVQRWAALMVDNFVEYDQFHSWCRKKCGRIIKLFNHNTFNVYCACGDSYCSNCLLNAHQSFDCKSTKVWNKFSKDFIWIRLHTKPCPSCNWPIEKYEGCNHVKCTMCQTDFCFNCVTIACPRNNTCGSGSGLRIFGRLIAAYLGLGSKTAAEDEVCTYLEAGKEIIN